MCLMSMPSESAAICAIAVSFPEPGEVTPVSTVTCPDGFTRTVAPS